MDFKIHKLDLIKDFGSEMSVKSHAVFRLDIYFNNRISIDGQDIFLTYVYFFKLELILAIVLEL